MTTLPPPAADDPEPTANHAPRVRAAPLVAGVALSVLAGLALDSRRRARRQAAQTADALRESEARKSAVLEVALDCIIAIDRDGRITEFNPAAEKTFGYAQA